MTDPDPGRQRARPTVGATDGGCWHVVIPVKDARHGKSRLARATGADLDSRVALNRAIAGDTIAAAVTALGATGVVLVTSDSALAAQHAALGVAVVEDPGRGLNAAIEAGLRRMPGPPSGERRPDSQSGRQPGGEPGRGADRRGGYWPRAALLGDLPCLTAGDLVSALSRASRHDQSFVPDAAGVGTVLRCSTTTSGFTPRFGTASADQHANDGAMRLDLALPRLRTDVDDLVSLDQAEGLGLGPLTRGVLARPRSG